VAALQILRGKGADISQEAEEIQVNMCYCWIYFFCDFAFMHNIKDGTLNIMPF
jgi:hypothetical protein